MRIVLTKRDPFSTPDGISHFLFSLANEFLANGHEVFGITTSDAHLESIPERFNYPRLPKIIELVQHSQEWGYIYECKTWLTKGSDAIESLKPDLVLVNGAALFRRRARAVTVTVAHDVNNRAFRGFSWPRKVFKAITYRQTDFLVTTCSELVTPVAKDAWFPASKIKVIPTCISPEFYKPKSIEDRSRSIVHVGMQPYKNPLGTIRAFIPVAHNATLYLVGRPSPVILAFCKTLPVDIQKTIIFPGIVSSEELKTLLETARIVSVPSEYPFPVASPTVLEAFAAHTPVVASPCISGDLIKPGFNCFLTKTEAEMTKAFTQLLESDTEWLHYSKGAALQAQNFSATRVTQQYLDLIQK